MRLPLLAASSILVLSLAFVLGCGAPTPPPPPLYPVTGQVQDLRGKPLTGGLVQFLRKEGDYLTTSAVIESDGRFTLSTVFENTNHAGAPEGVFEVQVTPPFGETGVPQTFSLANLCTIKPERNHFELRLPEAAN